jgi:hypothetical protein
VQANSDERIFDSEITARLSQPKELSAVFNRAIAVLPKVLKSGISSTNSMREAYSDVREATSPFEIWKRRYLTFRSTDNVPKDRLYYHYQDHTGQFLRQSEFGKRIMSIKGVGEARPTIDGKHVPHYTGIALKAMDEAF